MMPHNQSLPFGHPTAHGTSPAPGAMLTLRDTAKRLGCSFSTALRLVHIGRLPATWHRGSWAVPAAAIDRFLVEHATNGITAAACAGAGQVLTAPTGPLPGKGSGSPMSIHPPRDGAGPSEPGHPCPGDPLWAACPQDTGAPREAAGREGRAGASAWGPDRDDPLLPILVSLGRLVDDGGLDPRRPAARRLLHEIEGAAEQSLLSTKKLMEALTAWGRSIGAEAELASLMQVEACVLALRKHVRTELCLGLAAERLLATRPQGTDRASEVA